VQFLTTGSNTYKALFLLILFILFQPSRSLSQEKNDTNDVNRQDTTQKLHIDKKPNDTVKKTSSKDTKDTTDFMKHSPTKATLYSLALPGLGQAYNKKYWKIPVIYAGFGTLAYFIKTNNDYYQKYKKAYIYETDKDTTTINTSPSIEGLSAEQLLKAKNYYRRNLELSYIITGVLYILNVVDAAVDAHLYYFNVNDDLSMKIEPSLNPSFSRIKPAPELKLTFKF
jgi:hypothetical protein